MIMVDNRPELNRMGLSLRNIDSRYKPIMRMGISIDEMIYVARRLYPMVKASERILEVGCGNGLIGVILSKLLDREVYVIDDWNQVSKDDVMRNIKEDNAKVLLNDFHEGYGLPFDDRSFNLVYSVMFLSNIGREGRLKLGKEVLRVLKNNGLFIVVDTLVFRGKIRKDLEGMFKLKWYGEENGFSFFLWSNNLT
ncbi:class I SAM-dependent methyltransferase [Sulfolobus sp. A20-N-F6]|nr:class I SAM-dependent methyltransferase [Sulfolobus sp. A20-N-F8]TRM82049.1 class I SAM-dependent methyltransferase [Sulfolobus sp. D5]TRM83575.1 class I SAM-dependent methyltransferase [Sulfolobus sp. A20-N-F6]TRM85308.1 class I SAM-dependent methyltransferase [Sulfolobus sp. E3]TRM95314.1 class I SAM-dependent methyltransferase [Sulfolobus sp. A20-N-G8]TRM97329.1 class I SAM-dependent methyltransferase [Sulfolobus sp. B1]TRM98220.1 class I SAM-dependent methyltransferase [Sulfolobus sp. 